MATTLTVPVSLWQKGEGNGERCLCFVLAVNLSHRDHSCLPTNHHAHKEKLKKKKNISCQQSTVLFVDVTHLQIVWVKFKLGKL